MASDDAVAGAHGLDRTITLTDAVVAIAMTLLVLPLVELAPEVVRDGYGALVSNHRGVFLGFGLSFVVIYVFWVAHQRALAGLDDARRSIRVLNMVWLLVIAFLPFPTAVVGRAANTATVPVYIATMFLLSAVTAAITQMAAPAPGPRTVTLWVSTAVFAGCAMVSLGNADLGLFGLLLLVLVRVIGAVWPTVAGLRHDTPRPEGRERS